MHKTTKNSNSFISVSPTRSYFQTVAAACQLGVLHSTNLSPTPLQLEYTEGSPPSRGSCRMATRRPDSWWDTTSCLCLKRHQHKHTWPAPVQWHLPSKQLSLPLSNHVYIKHLLGGALFLQHDFLALLFKRLEHLQITFSGSAAQHSLSKVVY